MALIVSLDRGAIKQDLGDVQTVVLVGSELVTPDGGGAVIAKHMHNRWIAPERGGDAFMTLNVAGPLTVLAHGVHDSKLGPYMALSMTDGILYVDQRVFGIWDGENRDWYVKDFGGHCQRLEISFHATD